MPGRSTTPRTEYERALDLAKSHQGACPYANICEHCPSFCTDASHLGVLAAQRVSAEAPTADAAARG